MNDNFFKSKTVGEILTFYNFQLINNSNDSKWEDECKKHLLKRKISSEEFKIIQSSFESSEFIEQMANNIDAELDSLEKSNNHGIEQHQTIIDKLHETGNNIRKIGVYLLRFFLGQILFFLGVVLTISAGKTISVIVYFLYSLANLILFLVIVSKFYDAGNSLLSIEKNETDFS